MLIASLLPLLSHYSLGFDLVAGPDETVTLTIIPRRPEGTTHGGHVGEIRPIAITATAAEIDAELARGAAGALGQLVATRTSLGAQIAEQRQAAEDAKIAAAEAAKAKSATTPKPAAGAARVPASSSPPADAKPEEPASLW